MIAIITGHEYCEITDSKQDLLKKSGRNIGNYVHYKALRDGIIAQQVSLANFNDDVVDEFDTFVTSDFIFIQENSDFEWFSPVFDAINAKGKRLVLIGVGLQCGVQKDNFQIHENVLRMFRIISQQSTIGCRGEYTARILRSYGIDNVRVIGCPSLFYNQTSDWKINKKPELPENPKVLTHFTANPTQEITKNSILKFVEFISKYDSKFIDQTECFYSPWIPYLEPTRTAHLEELQNWYQKNRVYFYSIDDWIEYCEDFDFSIGGRFHGNVVPMYRNVPGLVLTRDSRTQELCEFLNIPHIKFTEFDKEKNLEYYYNLTDYTKFNEEYSVKHKNYFDFLDENGIMYRKPKPNLTLKVIEQEEEIENQENKIAELENNIVELENNIVELENNIVELEKEVQLFNDFKLTLKSLFSLKCFSVIYFIINGLIGFDYDYYVKENKDRHKLVYISPRRHFVAAGYPNKLKTKE